MLILRCVHLGELLSPLPGARLSGSCLSCEAPAQSQVQGNTRRNDSSGGGQLSSPRVSSCSNHHRSSPLGPGYSGAVGHISAQLGLPGGRSILAVLGPPCLCLPWEIWAGSWACPPAPWAPGPAPLESCSWPHSILFGEPLPEPPPSCSWAQPGGLCSPLGILAAVCGALSPGAQFLC